MEASARPPAPCFAAPTPGVGVGFAAAALLRGGGAGRRHAGTGARTTRAGGGPRASGGAVAPRAQPAMKRPRGAGHAARGPPNGGADHADSGSVQPRPAVPRQKLQPAAPPPAEALHHHQQQQQQEQQQQQQQHHHHHHPYHCQPRQQPLPPSSQPHRSESPVARAIRLAARGDTERARRALRAVVNRSPGDTRAWLALAKVEARAGDPGDEPSAAAAAAAAARAVFREACGENPECVHLLHAWAGLEERNRRFARAEKLYERCIDIEPHDGLAWQSYALLEEKLGRTAAARKRFAEGTSLAPKNAHLWSAWGVLENRHRNFDSACELFERAVDLDPKHARTIQAWAIAEEKRGNVGVAESLFRRALAIDPRSAPTYQAYALMQARRNELKHARTLFQEGIRVDPTHAAILHAWATMEAKAGNFERAREIFDRGVQAAPNSTPMLRAWAAMELELGHIDASNDWAVPRGTGPHAPHQRIHNAASALSIGKERRKLHQVGENLQMLRRLIERRSDEDLRTVMQWIEHRAKEERSLKKKIAVRGESDTRKVLEWAERRGEADVAAFKEFIDDRYERDRLIGVYLFNLDIPPLVKKLSPQPISIPATPSLERQQGLAPKPQEWYVLEGISGRSLDEFEELLYRSEGWNTSRMEDLAGIEFLSQVGTGLATRSALAFALCSLTFAITGMFVYLDLEGYTPRSIDTSSIEMALPPPTGVDAALTEYPSQNTN